MIQAIDLSRLRNAEFIQFAKDFTSLVNTNNPTELSVQPQYDVMTQKLGELETLFKNEISNPITTELEALDLRRDQAINGLIGVINAYGLHYETTMSSAAMVLQNNLKLYSTGIAKENYQSETAIIDNILNDWETKPELKAALAVLSITVWSKELKNINALFNEKYLARTQEYATASPDNQKSKRTEVMTAYYDLRKFLDAFSVIQSSATYDKTISELNALIDQYNTLLKGRTTTKTPETTTTPSAN